MAEDARLADAYARWRASPLGAITEDTEQRVVFDLAGPLAGRRALDVGTGDGAYAITAARKGARVTGIDVNPAMIAAARARSSAAGVSVAFREACAEELPFEDGAFDVLFAVTVLCFVPDPRRALREMARVLAHGGRLVLGELGRWSIWAAERRVRGWLGSPTWKRARFSSERDLTRLARAAGLQPLETRGAVFYPPSELAARLAAPFEPILTAFRAPGAAFLALAADKPASRT